MAAPLAEAAGAGAMAPSAVSVGSAALVGACAEAGGVHAASPSVLSAATVGLATVFGDCSAGGKKGASANAHSAGKVGSAAAVGLEHWGDFDQQMRDEGYFVFKALVRQDLVDKGVHAMQQRVQCVLEAYGEPFEADCGNLVRLAKLFGASPAGWSGAPFGGFDKRGWNKSVGNGRMFKDWDDPSIGAIRAATLPFAAHWHAVPESALVGQPESCSVKPGGAPRLPAHLDQGRLGTLQIVVALSDTEVVLWPRSHKMTFNPGGKG